MTNLKKLVTTMILAAPTLMSAQGFQVNLQGQVQQGMGTAGTALIQDGAALFFNPGGVAFLKDNSVDVGMTATIANGQFLDKNTGATARTNSPVSTPFTAYGVFGVKDTTKFLNKFKFGLGVYTPFGSTVDWEKGWMGRYALTHLQLKAIFFQPTVSFKICEKLGIGAGFVYSTGSVNLQKDIPVVYGSNLDVAHAELSGKASGIGANFGIYYKPFKYLSLGLTYRTQVNMKVSSGDATFTVPSSLSTNFPNGKFTAKLPLPSVLTLGVGFTPTDKLSFALDVNYVGWKAYDTLSFDYATNTTSLLDTKSARLYKNTFAVRLGGQYKITPAFAVRLGIAYANTPIQSGYVTPETPDASRYIYTAGVGYTIKNKFTINASMLYESLKREDTNIETNLSGTYQTKVVAPGLSLSYKF